MLVIVTAWLMVVIGLPPSQSFTGDEPKAESQERSRTKFMAADRDHDGQLTIDEFLANCRDSDRADRARRFRLFDFDNNGTLDAKEYHDYRAPVDERGTVPDPILDLETVVLAKWEAIFTGADDNQDGALSRQEWPAKRIATDIPALAELTFEHWDRGSDGNVDRADARRLLDVAYGMTQLDGQPLRTKTGRVFSWYYFRHLDAGDDGLVSEYEFGIRHNQGQVKNAEIFAQLDANGDGQLTDRETWSLLWHDTIGQFLDYDRNLDGYLTADEMEAIGWGRSIARQCVPAFDDNHDGQLSFREFRQTTFANQTSAWPIRHDTDRDGRLSWQEFYTEKPPLLIGQSRFFFDRFDRNNDGFLSILELQIENDHNQSQVMVYIGPLERCLPLQVQFAKHICQLHDDQVATLERDGYASLERLAEKTATAILKTQGARMMVDQNRRPTMVTPLPVDPALLNTPHLVVRQELAAALKARSPDSSERLDAERLRAEKRRRQAASLAFVSVLDEALLLSQKQRQELCELLAQDGSDAWRQLTNTSMLLDPAAEALFLTLAGGHVVTGFALPDAELAKRLTPTQFETLHELRRPQIQEVVTIQRAMQMPVAPRNAAGGAVAQARAAQAARAGMAGRVQAQVRVVGRIVHRGPTVEDQEKRLAQYNRRRLDDIDAACGLDKALRDKLSLAAKLDLARWREQASSPPAEELKEGEELVVQQVQVRGAAPLPVTIFTAADSRFFKSLQSRLSDEQRKKLTAADGERSAFQRRALVEATVAGYERAASLTSSQCDALASLLDPLLPDFDADNVAEWRLKSAWRLAELPFERLQPLLFDFQLAAAGEHQPHVTGAARQFEARLANQANRALPPAAMGNAIPAQ